MSSKPLILHACLLVFSLSRLGLPGCKADVGLPDLAIAEARERGAATLIVGVVNPGGVLPEHWVDTIVEAIALEKLKLPYEVKLWEFGDNAENGLKGAKFLAINENGRVPALEDPNSGVVSWESGAVMNYIRRKYDTQNKLGPQGKSEQDIVDFEKYEYFLLTTLGPMTGQTNWFR